MNENCIFCKIIKGEIPSFTIYEDECFKAILDRFPAAPGHVLVMPKAHAADIFDLPEETAAKLYPLVKQLAAKVKAVTGAEGINILQNNGEAAGQTVHHFHLHIIPRKVGDKVVLNQSSDGTTTLEALEEMMMRFNA